MLMYEVQFIFIKETVKYESVIYAYLVALDGL